MEHSATFQLDVHNFTMSNTGLRLTLSVLMEFSIKFESVQSGRPITVYI